MVKIVCTTCGGEHERSRVPKSCKGEPNKPKTGIYFYLIKFSDGSYTGFNTIQETADFLETTVNKIQNTLNIPEHWAVFNSSNHFNMSVVKIKKDNVAEFAKKVKGEELPH